MVIFIFWQQHLRNCFVGSGEKYHCVFLKPTVTFRLVYLLSGKKDYLFIYFVIWVKWPFKLCVLSLSNEMKWHFKKHFSYCKKKAFRGSGTIWQILSSAKNKSLEGGLFLTTKERNSIKIQGQAFIFTQDGTRTWHSLGSWICEFKASGPTSDSTMHNFPLAGRSGMPKYFLIHLSGLFLLWPRASLLHNSTGRTQLQAEGLSSH